jgi:hypothetical protein
MSVLPDWPVSVSTEHVFERAKYRLRFKIDNATEMV